VHLGYDGDVEAFRAELLEWLGRNPPPTEDGSRQFSSGAMPPGGGEWQRRLFNAGWLVPGWPPELGGRRATPRQQMAYFEEFDRLGIRRTYNPQGLSIVAPSILEFGDEAQRRQWVLPTLRAEVTWCLGLSEPNAGSDLAGLATRAELDGDHFVINGEKVWTSGAGDAEYCWCFVRTDPAVPKHQGISCIIVPMRQPGVQFRPLAPLTDKDHADFGQVYFTNVTAPAENLVGGLNNGWRVSMGQLAHERGLLWMHFVTAVEKNFEHLVALGSHAGPGGTDLRQDARFRDQVGRFYVEALALRCMGYRGFTSFARGEPSPVQQLMKVASAEVGQRLLLAMLEALGIEAMEPWEGGRFGMFGAGTWALEYLASFHDTIGGGTSEIQRNIIARRVLGLPGR